MASLEQTIDSVELAVYVGVSGTAALLVVSCCSFFICTYCGCCGPQSLTPGDIRALTTFSDIYRFQAIELEKDYFEKAEFKAWCKLWRYTRPASPVHHWASLLAGISKGFLVETAHHIDRVLLAYQYRMWEKKGNFVENLPTFLVAQEWRHWAMTTLQRMEVPGEENKEEIERRLRWIAAAREVARHEIMDLRESQGWDETAELSLLQVMRQDIGRELRLVYDRWENFQLQLSFERQASILDGYLIQFVRAGVEFLARILQQQPTGVQDTEVMSSDAMIPSAPLTCCNSTVVIADKSEITTPFFCCGKKEWNAYALSREVAAWANKINLFDPEFPNKYRAHFFTEERLKDIEDGKLSIKRLKPESPFADWNGDRLTPTEKDLADAVLHGIDAEAFGLKEQEMTVMVQRCVSLFTGLQIIRVAFMVMESLRNFAVLGGSLFLAEKVSSDHVREVLNFVCVALKSAEFDLIAVADLAQAGWSNNRRHNLESPWSNDSPVDNVRASLRVKTDMGRMAVEADSMVKQMQVEMTRARKANSETGRQALAKEVEFHDLLWK
ncbi:unnamed protein product, partial [Effrenium voratum]